jgi:two-component system sensor histidine kinase ChvG
MRLRHQLLLLALSTLALPWAGWQFVRELERLLREGQSEIQMATAQTLARALGPSVAALPLAGDGLVAVPLQQPIALDGYAGEWNGVPRESLDARSRLHARAAFRDDALYLLVDVADRRRVAADAHWPQAPLSDHLQLGVELDGRWRELRLASAAPGPLIAVETTRPAPPAPLRLLGEWQEDASGYRVELRLPRALLPTRLRLRALDFGAAGTPPQILGDDSARTLVYPPQNLQTDLQPLLAPGLQARVLYPDGSVLAAAGELQQAPPGASGWRRALYALLRNEAALPQVEALEQRHLSPESLGSQLDQVHSSWHQNADDEDTVLRSRVPLLLDGEPRALLLLERRSDAVLLADRALSGLMLTSFVVLALVAAALLLFASRLGARIRKLNRAAEQALQRQHQLEDAPIAPFVASTASDELGELSRSFGRLIDEVDSYTDYLRTLAAKLSHELHTPLAVVRSSLDNLEPQRLDAEASVFVQRARDGVDRLGAIVRAMSESSRIERAIAAAEPEDFDLRELIAGCAEGYRPLLAPRELKLLLPPGPLRFHGAPDLLVQALDKLVDNARSFTPEDGWVLLALAGSADGVEIAVANRGPLLPEGNRQRLFESLVSLRSTRAAGTSHLGLGLYVVRLVASLHRGQARAANLPSNEGVEFRLSLRGMARQGLLR